MTPQALDNFDIPADLDQCQQMINQLIVALKEAIGKLDERDEKIQELEHRLQLLLRAKFGRISETIGPGQLRIFDEGSAQEEDASDEIHRERPRNHSGHGRRKPSKNLTRRPVVRELSPEERRCPDCGEQREPIGEEVSERYSYNPASVEVIEEHRVKYCCNSCNGNIVVAGVPQTPIPKGLADGSMISYVAVSKFADHLPLHRLEGIFRRHGAEIARSTMCDWLAAGADILMPLYMRMKERVLSSRVIWTDDTPVKLQDRQHKDNMITAREWAYHGDRKNDFILYDFTDSRRRDGPVDFLKDFKGFLQADAYAGYDHVYAAQTVREVACWAHARRKFLDSLNSNKKKAHRALRHIQLLYRIEKRWAMRQDEEKLRIRQTRSRKILRLLKTWLDKEVLVELKGPLSKAIRYALNNWDALCTFTEDAELTIDNNKAERGMRTVAIGRKNWLFFGSRDGGKRAAVFYSLIASCKIHNVDPLAYLTDVFNKLCCTTPPSDLDTLLPDVWKRAA